MVLEEGMGEGGMKGVLYIHMFLKEVGGIGDVIKIIYARKAIKF